MPGILDASAADVFSQGRPEGLISYPLIVFERLFLSLYHRDSKLSATGRTNCLLEFA